MGDRQRVGQRGQLRRAAQFEAEIGKGVDAARVITDEHVLVGCPQHDGRMGDGVAIAEIKLMEGK